MDENGGNGGTRARFKYDPTISMGNIITVVALVGSLLMAYFKLDGRVSIVEMQSDANREMISRQTDILNRMEVSQARTDTLMEIYGSAITELQKQKAQK